MGRGEDGAWVSYHYGGGAKVRRSLIWDTDKSKSLDRTAQGEVEGSVTNAAMAESQMPTRYFHLGQWCTPLTSTSGIFDFAPLTNGCLSLYSALSTPSMHTQWQAFTLI